MGKMVLFGGKLGAMPKLNGYPQIEPYFSNKV
jgi:hypothetical protein